MKFFLDENLPPVVERPLLAVWGAQHEFETAASLGVTGVDDVDLYRTVRAAGVLALVSKDDRQLKNQAERRGLFDNRLSFVHLRTSSVGGRKGFALLVASLVAGIPFVADNWVPEPHAFRLRGLQSGFTERVSSFRPLWQAAWGEKPAAD